MSSLALIAGLIDNAVTLRTKVVLMGHKPINNTQVDRDFRYLSKIKILISLVYLICHCLCFIHKSILQTINIC